MKAAVFHGSGEPVTVEEVPDPRPAVGEVLIRVAGCGVCHTDLHYLDHGTPTFKPPPMILGHEVSGVIVEVAEGVEGFTPGDRVLAAAVLSCGACEACRVGRENICENSVMLGNHADGGYAELVAVRAKDVFHLPDEIPLVEGSVIADAVTTPYHAVVNRGRVTPGDWVVVVGCGGVGLNVVQMASAVGARVIAVDVVESKLDWATRLGATEVIDSGAVERVDKAVRGVTGGGAHVAFEVVGKAATQELGLSCLRTGGRLVLVGYSPEKMSLNAGRVMFREMEIVGSLGCRPVDYPRVIEMVRQGRVRVTELVTHKYSLDDIAEAFDGARAGLGIRGVVTP
ncbi:MAG: zinc-binding dehydrogenase [Gemmatimonadota bacterium]|nr:zinc-binding dehydrogenase [Gemmatimonadota bacterium]